MKWQLRRFFLGDRRRSDRVVSEAKAALQRLDQALSTMELAGNYDYDRGDDDDQP